MVKRMTKKIGMKTFSLLIKIEPNNRAIPPKIQTFDPNLWVLYQTR